MRQMNGYDNGHGCLRFCCNENTVRGERACLPLFKRKERWSWTSRAACQEWTFQMVFDEQANEEIERAIVTEWDSWTRPLLISHLGTVLSSETKAALSETGHGLKRYIQENLGSRIRLVPMRARGGGVAPVDKTQNLSDVELEDLYNKRQMPVQSSPLVPTYWGDVWRGFQSELAKGLVRYLLVDSSNPPVVGTVPEGTVLPNGARQIEAGDLVLTKPGEPRPPRTSVQQAIERWCLKEGLSPKVLEFNRSQQPSTRPVEEGIEPRKRPVALRSSSNDRVSSLMAGIDLLSSDELARINIPADLVLTILRRATSR